MSFPWAQQYKPQSTVMQWVDERLPLPRLVYNAVGAGYPVPFDAPCLGRRRWALGDVAGLTQFGVNLLRLPPSQWSSQRHWHLAEDEFVYVISGECQ